MEKDKALIDTMKALSDTHSRYGCRRITALLRADGWRVNRKRVGRLWRQEGLKVAVRQEKTASIGLVGEQLHPPSGRADQPGVDV